jgi:outer membrane protein assembly factor BamA
MRSAPKHNNFGLWLLFVLALAGLLTSCSPTKHVPQGQYLLRSNSVQFKAGSNERRGIVKRVVTIFKRDPTQEKKGELKDGVSSLVIQKPNTYFLIFPYKVWLYNRGYKKYTRDSAAEAFQRKQKTVERPVVYDSALAARSTLHMKSYLFNQGYFYATVRDTVQYLGHRKIKAIYEVETGQRYIVNQTTLDIDDSTIKAIVAEHMSESVLQQGKPFAMVLADEERTRIADILRNLGYYKFSRDNIRIVADTFNKDLLLGVEDPFSAAIRYEAKQKEPATLNVDLRVIVRAGEETNAYRRYGIGKVRVYPDFVDRKDINDPTMHEFIADSVIFRYHDHFIRERVLLNQIFLRPGELYTQNNYDQTITKLNELGLFQYVQIYLIEDSTLPADHNLRCVILMNPTKRYDFTANVEVTSGSTYTAGTSVVLSFRNRNMARGGNQLTIALNGGVEYGYSADSGGNVFQRLYSLSRNAGINSTIQFPKFLAPFNIKGFPRNNQPRTVIGLGINLLDRIDYFTLINTTTTLNYNWQQSKTNTWDLSPVFINVQHLPSIAESFNERLQNNELLKNTYSELFVEGENLFFTFSDRNAPGSKRRYSYVRAGIEESGALLSLVDKVVGARDSADNANREIFGLKYSQYVKLEADLRHYWRREHAELATRLFMGFGLPYDKSSVLPYIKQYYVGGPYSLRGWRVRQLGPGSFYDTVQHQYIDRTGDIKLEANVELRFDMFDLFGGALQVNGAAFMDAGNIWLAKPSPNFPRGNFTFEHLFDDLAISTGLGIRFDISGLFVLRADAGVPIKNPDYPVNGNWDAAQNVHLFDLNWLFSGLVGHFAIGYPF